MATARPRNIVEDLPAPTAIEAPPIGRHHQDKAAVAICCGVKKALNRFIL